MDTFKKKMLKYALLSLTTIFVIVLLLIFHYNRKELAESFEKRMSWITSAVLMSSREPLWNLDETILKENIDSFLQISGVSEIIVQEIMDYLVIETGSKPREENRITVEEPIRKDGQLIGEVTIHFSDAELQRRINRSLMALIMQISFLFVLVAGLVAFMSKKYTEPIVGLARAIKKFDIRDPSSYELIWENTEVEEIQAVIKSFKEMAEEITANYQEMEATNETLKEMNEKLEIKSEENRLLAGKLSRIIEISGKFDEATEMSEKTFMQTLFRKAFEIISEADYGSVYVYGEKNVEFVDAVGHDMELLNKTRIPKDIFMKNSVDVGIEQNMLNYTEDKLVEKKAVQQAQTKENGDFNILKRATKDFKETLYFELFVGDVAQGGVSLDIRRESDKHFNRESIEAMKAFQSLATAFYKVQRYSNMKESFTKEIIISIVKMLEIHDNYTKGHSESVANLTAQLAEEINLSNKDKKRAFWAGLVHDIGKILIPDAVLNKSSKLTNEEFSIIKKHPVWGYETLKNSDQLKDIAILVLHHHERYDGRGYPDGLSGEDIPQISRIINVVDSWDAMTTRRSYREPLDKKTALKEIEDNAGKQFDPLIAEAFLKMRQRETRGQVK